MLHRDQLIRSLKREISRAPVWIEKSSPSAVKRLAFVSATPVSSVEEKDLLANIQKAVSLPAEEMVFLTLDQCRSTLCEAAVLFGKNLEPDWPHGALPKMIHSLTLKELLENLQKKKELWKQLKELVSEFSSSSLSRR